MNSRTVMMIVVIGGLGLIGLLIATIMGFGQIPEERKAFIKIALEIAQKHDVREVVVVVSPPFSDRQTLKVHYETSTMVTSDVRTQEMETVAKLAWERMEPEKRKSIRVAEVRRTWRSERGCFRRSDVSTHEWTPPPPPPGGRRP